MRKGRELEQLIERIKSLQLPDACVMSPEYVSDRDTGQRREVDIGVRIPREGGEVFIAIECRDRAATEDVEWVEQLISKKESVGAHALIAVSSSGFSEPARIKAIKRGVLLKKMIDRLPQDVEKLSNSVFVTFKYLQPRLLSIEIVAKDNLDRPLDTYKYRHDSSQNELTIGELSRVLNSPEFIRGIASKIKKLRGDGSYRHEQFPRDEIAVASPTKIDAVMVTPEGDVPIARARLTYVLNYGELQLPLLSIKEYFATDMPDNDDATAFTFGTDDAVLSEVLLDKQTSSMRFDIICKPLLAEGKVFIGAELKAREPVRPSVMRVDL